MPEPIVETSTAAAKRIATSAGKESVLSFCAARKRSLLLSGSTIVILPSHRISMAISAADEADDDPLDHERPADEPAGRADQAHHLDLAAAGVDREPDRVADQHQRGERSAAP